MVTGKLSLDGQALAEYAGKKRYRRRRAAGSKQRYGRKQSDHTTELEIEAIGAEIFVGELLGERWRDTDSPDYHGDVGLGNQVRHTRRENGRLLLHDSDKDDHIFYLVIGTYPEYTVIGSIVGGEGKRVGVVRELQPGRPAICVEQADLTPFARKLIQT